MDDSMNEIWTKITYKVIFLSLCFLSNVNIIIFLNA